MVILWTRLLSKFLKYGNLGRIAHKEKKQDPGRNMQLGVFWQYST
jgi:hypothetical protein